MSCCHWPWRGWLDTSSVSVDCDSGRPMWKSFHFHTVTLHTNSPSRSHRNALKCMCPMKKQRLSCKSAATETLGPTVCARAAQCQAAWQPLKHGSCWETLISRLLTSFYFLRLLLPPTPTSPSLSSLFIAPTYMWTFRRTAPHTHHYLASRHVSRIVILLQCWTMHFTNNSSFRGKYLMWPSGLL